MTNEQILSTLDLLRREEIKNTEAANELSEYRPMEAVAQYHKGKANGLLVAVALFEIILKQEGVIK
jgi:hypothetical protein